MVAVTLGAPFVISLLFAGNATGLAMLGSVSGVATGALAASLAGIPAQLALQRFAAMRITLPNVQISNIRRDEDRLVLRFAGAEAVVELLDEDCAVVARRMESAGVSREFPAAPHDAHGMHDMMDRCELGTISEYYLVCGDPGNGGDAFLEQVTIEFPSFHASLDYSEAHGTAEDA